MDLMRGIAATEIRQPLPRVLSGVDRRCVVTAGLWAAALLVLLATHPPLPHVTLVAGGLGAGFGLLLAVLRGRARVHAYLASLTALAALGVFAQLEAASGSQMLIVQALSLLVPLGVIAGELEAEPEHYGLIGVAAVLLPGGALVAAPSLEGAWMAGLWATGLMSGMAGILAVQARQRARHAAQLEGLKRLALRDPLTGLANRHGWTLDAGRAYQQAAREQRPLTVAMIDADHFKQVNDRYGHAAGDAVIRHIGEQIRSLTRRPLDVAARLGGEEYAVIWYDCDPLTGQRMAEALRASIAAAPVVVEGRPVPVTVSIGLCQVVPDEGQSLELALASADAALYAAKVSGRNRVTAKQYLPRPAPAQAA